MTVNLRLLIVIFLISKDAAGANNSKLHRSHPAQTITVELEKEEQSRTLPCDVEGYSTKPKSFDWTKKNDDNWSVQPPNSLNQDHSLVLVKLKPSDSGKYVCRACIDEDCAKSVFTLEVTHKMKETSMLNKTVLINSTVQFECLLKNETIMNYSVEFYKYHIIKQKHLRHLMNLTALINLNDSFLELKNVTVKDEGWYTCAVIGGKNYQFKEKKKFERNFIAYKSAFLKVLEKWPDDFFLEENSIPVNVVLISSATVSMVLITLLGIMCYNMKRKKLEVSSLEFERQPSIMVMNNFYEPCQDWSEYETLTDSKWEYPRNKLTFRNILGVGAFGKVVLAEALDLLEEGKTINVAIKMLKENHTDDDIKDLIGEMELLKKIDKHPNVISFLGCCTRDGPLYVIVEYAVHGNLKDFLRDHRSALHKSKLISFALQISNGMEYLSAKKIIHRDLAARNILVGEDYTMKISDFGLARDIHSRDYYQKMTSGKLPIYWMAPESLKKLIFDSRSDVWSFGVLFWEIITLGRHPYPVAPGWENLLAFLKQGNRLGRPKSCPDEIHQIMSNCWRLDAKLRPTFSEIAAALENVICTEIIIEK